jgi:hypothetical protein
MESEVDPAQAGGCLFRESVLGWISRRPPTCGPSPEAFFQFIPNPTVRL